MQEEEMQEFKVWAVKHLPSGKFLPNCGRMPKTGYTHLEPSEGIPRLFTRKTAAELALRAWAAGKIVMVPVRDGIDRSWSETDHYRQENRPVKGRKREEMAVVEMILVELAPQLALESP